jgi:hypothetical protein
VRATSVVDGWGYLSLFRRQAGKVERIDSYAIPEALDPAFEREISKVLVWLRRLSDGCGA